MLSQMCCSCFPRTYNGYTVFVLIPSALYVFFTMIHDRHCFRADRSNRHCLGSGGIWPVLDVRRWALPQSHRTFRFSFLHDRWNLHLHRRVHSTQVSIGQG